MGGEQNIIELTVDGGEGDARLDRWLTSRLAGPSRAAVQRQIAGSRITINGVAGRRSQRLQPGDEVRVTWENPSPQDLAPVPMAFAVAFEDDDLVVVDKPAGLTVHPGAGSREPTLLHGLLHHCRQLARSTMPRPGIVHRLDKDTTGLMVCAKTEAAHHHLAGQFAAKTNTRRYLTLMDGVLSEPLVVRESHLARDPANRLRMSSQPSGKWARSQFRTLAVYGGALSLVEATLTTGRTHQIRVHAKDLGAPVIGDALYGRRRIWPQTIAPEVRAALTAASRQMLHAQVLGFRHPRSGAELTFWARPPADFLDLLKLLEPYA